jgi:chemotaxis protein MotB
MTAADERQYLAENRSCLIPLKRRDSRPLCSADRVEADKGAEIWLITLSDLLMLLLIFFVILFGIEMQKRQTPGKTVRAEFKERTIEKVIAIDPDPSLLDMTASIEKELIATLDLEKGPQGMMVKRVSNLVTLTFPEQIVFDPGHAELKPSAQPTLDKVASFIKERPSLIVEVQGHTDDRPINNSRYPSNWELSVDRATQVAKALIGLGVDPTRFSVKGFGEYRLLSPNDSDENRLRNRRVEIQFALPPRGTSDRA